MVEKEMVKVVAAMAVDGCEEQETEVGDEDEVEDDHRGPWMVTVEEVKDQVGLEHDRVHDRRVGGENVARVLSNEGVDHHDAIEMEADDAVVHGGVVEVVMMRKMVVEVVPPSLFGVAAAAVAALTARDHE